MSQLEYFSLIDRKWFPVTPIGAAIATSSRWLVRLTGPLAICAGCKGDVAVGDCSSDGTPWCGAGACLTIINTTSTRSEG